VRFHGRAGSDERFFLDVMDKESEGFVDLTLENYSVPLVDTVYFSLCLDYSDLISRGLPDQSLVHIIGYLPLIDSGVGGHLHHFLVHAMEDEIVPGNSCSSHYGDFAYGWAPGAGPIMFPSEVGFPVGKNGYKSFRIVFHFDNPRLESGLRDNSGFRLYYTSQARQHVAGVLRLGDPNTLLKGRLLGNGWSEHQFDCPSSCTQSMFFDDNVTVFGEFFHMHRKGRRFVNRLFREGSDSAVHESFVDFFDFSQAGAYLIQQHPYIIQRADSFKTTCFFQADDKAAFGYGSGDEMCIAYLFYFPRQDVPLDSCGALLPFHRCRAQHSSVILENDRYLSRMFGSKNKMRNYSMPLPSASPSLEATSFPVTSQPSIVEKRIFESTGEPTIWPSPKLDTLTWPSGAPSPRPSLAGEESSSCAKMLVAHFAIFVYFGMLMIC